jgi:protein ImuA
MMPTVCERADLLARLRGEIITRERGGEATDRSVVRTGWPALDRILPRGGIRRGSLVELLGAGPSSGAETVAAVLTRALCQHPGAVVVVDQAGEFYPPALAAWQVGYEQLIVARPASDADALWAADQALRSRAASVVWLWRDQLAAHDFRRLQLSAEEGGAVGLLLRPTRVARQPTWADVQFTVEPRPGMRGRRLRIELTRCRGGTPGSTVEIEFDDVTGATWECTCREAPRLFTAAALAGPAAAG